LVRFIRIKEYHINVNNIAFIDTKAYVPTDGEPLPAFHIVFNSAVGQRALDLWLSGEYLTAAE